MAIGAQSKYNLKALHDFLVTAFNIEELGLLIAYDDRFADLRNGFGPNDPLAVRANKAVEFCDRRWLFEEFLALVEQERPDQYPELASRLFAPATSGAHLAIHQALQEPGYERLPRTDVPFFGILIAEKTHGFVGRQFVFDALDRFLEENRCGYFLIEGEPGIGKTALMAQLAKTRGYAHHFNVALQDIRTPRQFLANACAQIIVHYRLAHRSLPEGATQNSGFLVQCLAEAAADSQNRPVVLLVDALDESDRLAISPRGAALHLPSVVPEGAFIVVTSRPQYDPHLPPSDLHTLFLEPGSDGNLLDIRTYIEERLQASEALRSSLSRRNVGEEAFVRELVDKSEGNFMYLYHVLPAYAQGRISELPRGLNAYYLNHWRAMREAGSDEFKQLYAPIVAKLAVVHEPISVEMLSMFTGKEPGQIEKAVRLWREFLEVDRSSGEERYRVYHASFRDFLNEHR